MNNKECVILILLDLSAAFDTIDQDRLISRLESRFGVQGSALKWFEAYLSNRSQQVVVGNVLSEPSSLKYGVPQGSVLGPILYTLYTDPIGRIISSHGLNYHLYADDTQLYIPVTLQTQTESTDIVTKCVDDIKSWMTNNKLKLNDDKTELIVFKPQRAEAVDIEHIYVGKTKITDSAVVRNLGVQLDSHLSMEPHINKICQSAYFHLKNIGKIRHLIDKDTCKLLINSFVTSRLDYCNSLLYGVNKGAIDKLQKIQNQAARIITRTKKFEHITPALRALHWLPVEQRIVYKILLMTFKCLHGQAPEYLTSLLHEHKPTRQLRSSASVMLDQPSTKSRFSERASSVCAPMLWNSLSTSTRCCKSVKTFKTHLKTELFRRTFCE